VADEDRVRIVRAFRRGVPVRSLARRTCQPRSAIYRVVVEERVAKLNKRKVKFIDDPLYHEADADEAVAAIVSQDDVMGSTGRRESEESRVPRDLPPYLQALYRTPLLSPPRERSLFLAFNYHKYRFVTARRKLEPDFARARDLAEMEGHLRRATELKNQIVQANLRLVVSVARKHLRTGLSLMELVSDGNITLMRAVESFDVHKGNRFSTYATLALMKGFARSVPQMMAARATGAPDDLLAEIPDRRLSAATERLLEREEARELLGRLDDRERSVLLAHFGLNDGRLDDGPAPAPATYEQVGRRLGMSKERVRQIEQNALAKLRAVAAPAA
jgi:RNA polymerase sigma factor (sigma-70 family)